MNVLLLLVTNLYAYSVDSTRTNWVNQYDGALSWTTSGNRMVTGFYSKHDNHKEDRMWKFDHGSVSGVQCSSRRWVNDMNSYDGVLSFSCNPKEAISGFRSTHDNRREDRRWDIQCCTVSNVMLVSMGFTGYLNNWDGVLDFTCDDDEVLVGVYSVHDNGREDRRWKAKCAQLTNSAGFNIDSRWTDWENRWDADLEVDAGVNGMITGIYSVHDNGKEDRRWKFLYGSAPGLDCYEQSWTSWKNNWDQYLSYSCPSNQVLHGVQSYHSNHKEDRRWKFQCCRLSSGVSVHRGPWTGYLNNWDGELHHQCPAANQAIIGLSSYHDNKKEDRRWKVRCGELRN